MDLMEFLTSLPKTVLKYCGKVWKDPYDGTRKTEHVKAEAVSPEKRSSERKKKKNVIGYK